MEKTPVRRIPSSNLFDSDGNPADVDMAFKKDGDLRIMDSKEYVIIDHYALAYIKANFTPAEYGRILLMSDMTYGKLNALVDDMDMLHTDQTLQEAIDYTRNAYRVFMKKLYKKGIIWYLMGCSGGREIKVIILNPHLARKRKDIHVNCLKHFQDISRYNTATGMVEAPHPHGEITDEP